MTTTTLTRRQLLLAYTTGGFGLSTNAMIYFLVPLRAAELGAGVGVIGVLLGMKALVETLLSVPLGAFMDRAGPRRAYVLGTAGTALAGLGLMVAPSIAALFALQAFLGAVRPLGWVGGQSYVSGLRTGADRTYDTGRFSFAANVGQIFAPLLAGVLVQLVGVQVGFVVVVAYGVVFCVLGLLLADVARPPASGGGDKAGGAATLRLLRLRGIQVVMALTFVRLWLTSVWNSFFPLYLVTIGTAATIAGSVVSSMALVATLTSLFTGRISRLGGPAPLTAAALGLACAGLALSPVLTDAPEVYLAALLVGIGQGLSLPLLLVLVSAAAPAGQRGLALGLRSSVNQGAATAAPVLIAPIIGAAGVAVGFPLAGALAGVLLAVAMVLDRSSDA